MEEQLVSLKVAKLLREKGFRQLVPKYYDENEIIVCKLGDWNSPLFKGMLNSAPTQSLAQKWLREIHTTYVLIDIGPIGFYFHIISGKLDYTGDYYITYEAALEAGLEMTLRYI